MPFFAALRRLARMSPRQDLNPKITVSRKRCVEGCIYTTRPAGQDFSVVTCDESHWSSVFNEFFAQSEKCYFFIDPRICMCVMSRVMKLHNVRFLSSNFRLIFLILKNIKPPQDHVVRFYIYNQFNFVLEEPSLTIAMQP
jgi:hypothetical protein